MQKPQSEIAAALAGAHAMTDVTGFGLGGHLAGICAASGVGATVRLADVTLMQGAMALAESGVRSSLYPDNRMLQGISAPDTAQGALMFDPQTGGGLLAALSPQDAKRVATLPEVQIIGTLTNGYGVTFE